MTRHGRLPAAALPVVALLVAMALALSACGPTRTKADDDVTCNDADQKVVDTIMSTARTNFREKPGASITDHIEFVKAATAPIPESKRKFGAAELMVLLVAVYIQDPEIPSDLQGVQGPVYVVLDDDGQPLGPLGTFSQPYFDIQPPDDPGWTAWADGVDDSDVAYDLFRCVNPG